MNNLLSSINTLINSPIHGNTYNELSLSLQYKKDTIIECIEKKDIDSIITFIMSVYQYKKDELKNILISSDMYNIWFILLKRCFPEDLYQLYEMNIFYHSYSLLYKEGDDIHWIDQCLNDIYNEYLVNELDRTIFYNKESSYIMNIKDYIDDMVNKTASITNKKNYESDDNITLYNTMLNPFYHNKHKECIENFRKYSLNSYYGDTKEKFCYYGKIIHLKIREMILLIMKDSFKMIRDLYKNKEYDEHAYNTLKCIFHDYINIIIKIEHNDNDDGEEDSNIYLNTTNNDIWVIFDMILSHIKNIIIDSNHKQRLIDNLTEHINTRIHDITRDINNKYDIYGNIKQSVYTIFQHDSYFDIKINLNREKYSWLLPFNRVLYTNTSLCLLKNEYNESSSAYPFSYNESIHITNKILYQESVLWFNFLILVIYRDHFHHNIKEKEDASQIHSSILCMDEDELIKELDDHNNTKNKRKHTTNDNKNKRIKIGDILMDYNKKENVYKVIEGNGNIIIYNENTQKTMSTPVYKGKRFSFPNGCHFKT